MKSTHIPMSEVTFLAHRAAQMAEELLSYPPVVGESVNSARKAAANPGDDGGGDSGGGDCSGLGARGERGARGVRTEKNRQLVCRDRIRQPPYRAAHISTHWSS